MKGRVLLNAFLCLFLCGAFAYGEKSQGYFIDEENPVKLSGMMKFFVHDQIDGEALGRDQETNSSAGFSMGNIILDKSFDQNVLVHAEFEFLPANAGATPRLGEDFDRKWSSDIKSRVLTANLTYIFENGVEVRAGVFKPLFSWDYGYELGWNETYHLLDTSANTWLNAYVDSGVEVMKSFTFEKFKIPLFVYMLNGKGSSGYGDYTDNNDSRSWMLHAAPEFLEGKLRFNFSYSSGKWDDEDEYDFSRMCYGISMDWDILRLRWEHTEGEWDHTTLVFTPTLYKDINPKGDYIKALFHVHEKVDLKAAYALVKHDFSGFYYVGSAYEEEYEDIVLGVSYFLNAGVTLMLDWAMVDAERDDPGKTDMEFDRITLGARINI